MAEAHGEAEAAADRLEAALERIATMAARPAVATPPALAMPEVAERLAQLRDQGIEALDGPAT
jgi:hypothetical protein